MSKITSSDFRSWETKALADDGVITAKEAGELKKLVGAEKLDANEKAVLRDIVQHDRFEPKAKATVAKLSGTTKLASSPVLGVEVAKGVFVQQSFSPVKGHRTQEQALAAARMSGAKNPMAVPDKSGRWHAVDVTKPVGKGDTLKNGAVDLHDCPPAAFESAQKAAAAAKTPEEKKAAYQKLAAITFGVPESKINVMTSTTDKPVKGMININAAGTMGDAAGRITSGCDCGKSHENFKPGDEGYAIQIKADKLADPKKAASTMFHELTHAEHYVQAQAAFKAYSKAHPDEAKALAQADFSDRHNLSPAAMKAEAHFQGWIHSTKDKALKGMTQQDRDTVLGYVTGQTGATEATAYSQSWMQSFRDHASRKPSTVDLAGELLSFASGQTGSTVPLSQAGMKQVFSELNAFYATLTPDEQKQFKDVMAFIKAKHPKSQLAAYSPPA